jgi:hypothetical protein
MPVLAEDKLAIYNGALRRVGARKLASLTENREPRRVLDDAWGDTDNLVKKALAKGEWNFSIIAAQVDASPSVDPDFGFTYAYDKPADFLRMAAISANDRFVPPLDARGYADEAGYWFADHQVIYIRYVSAETGLVSSGWPDLFRQYLECYLASEVCERLTNSRTKRQELLADADDALRGAKSNDSMNEGTKPLPRGSWSRSRGAYR